MQYSYSFTYSKPYYGVTNIEVIASEICCKSMIQTSSETLQNVTMISLKKNPHAYMLEFGEDEIFGLICGIGLPFAQRLHAFLPDSTCACRCRVAVYITGAQDDLVKQIISYY